MNENSLKLLVGIVSIVNLIVFSVKLAQKSVSQNIATWLMWFVLNSIIALGSFASGNRAPWLPFGFAVGAVFVSIILFKKGNWKWGFVETVCAIGSIVAMVVGYFLEPKWAVVASCTAMWIASVPLIYDTMIAPDPTFWWMWATSTVCATVTLALTDSWSIGERLFPISSVIFNGGMTFLTLRTLETPVFEMQDE